MKLSWQVRLGDETALISGYGETPAAALADLYRQVDACATQAQESASRITAEMLRVRGELDELSDV